MNDHLSFYDAFFYKDYMYFSCIDFNALFRIKKGQRDAEFVGEFECENSWMVSMHRRVFYDSGRLFFVPYFGKGIHIYDLDKKEFSLLELAKSEDEYVHFSNAFWFDETLVLIPSNRITLEKGFYLFNPKACTGKWDSRFISEIKKMIPDDIEYIFDVWGTVYDSSNKMLYMCIYGTNILLIIDLIGKNVDFNFSDDQFRLRNIAGNPAQDGVIYASTVGSKEMIVFDIVSHDFKYHHAPAIAMSFVDLGDRVLLVPEDDIFPWYAKKNEGMEFVQIRSGSLYNVELDIINKGHSMYVGYHYDKLSRTFYLFPRSLNRMLAINIFTDEIKYSEVKFGKDFDYIRRKIVEEEFNYRFQSQENIKYEVLPTDLYNYIKLYTCHQ